VRTVSLSVDTIKRDMFFPSIIIDNYNGQTVILTGKQDSIVGYADVFPILKRYPRATFIILDGAGHNLQIEQEEEFNHIFRCFLF